MWGWDACVARVLFLWLLSWGNTTPPRGLSPRHISQRPPPLMPARGITTFGLAHPPPSPPGDTLRGGGEWGWLRCSDVPCGHQACGLLPGDREGNQILLHRI